MLAIHKLGLLFLLVGCAEPSDEMAAWGSPAGGAAGSGGSTISAGGSAGQARPVPSNPCTDGTHDCDENASCSGSSSGSYSCACNTGFEGDGKSCSKSACELIEGFEGEWPYLPWMATGWGVQGTGPQAAHDGALGLVASEWQINQFVYVGVPGDRLTAWVRGYGGRAYLGFGSTPNGTKALVFAPNAGSLLLDDCPGFYTFNDIKTQPIPASQGPWHKLEIEFGAGGQVTGRLYGPDGAVVTTLSHTFDDLTPGGIAVRAFNDTFIDTVELCRE